MRAPFELLEPIGPETPVIVEIPHAAVDVPPPFLETVAAPVRAIGRDADLHVDALYQDAPTVGATLLVARLSRYVVDLNRGEGDVDADAVEGGRSDVRMNHGLIWRTTSDGEPALTRRLSPSELQERLDLVWRPYHRALAELVARKRRRFGLAVVLAAHSMPSVDRLGNREAWSERSGVRAAAGAENGPAIVSHRGREVHARADRTEETRPRADVVPGTRGRRSADGRLIDLVEAHATAAGWSVRHDDPYAGGFTTQHYGRPADGVHAIQVELARRLYLDESTLRPNASFDTARGWCKGLVGRLGELALHG